MALTDFLPFRVLPRQPPHWGFPQKAGGLGRGAGGAGPAGLWPRTEVPWNKAGAKRDPVLKRPVKGAQLGKGFLRLPSEGTRPPLSPASSGFSCYFLRLPGCLTVAVEPSRTRGGSSKANTNRPDRGSARSEPRPSCWRWREQWLEVEGNSGSGSLLPSPGAPLCTDLRAHPAERKPCTAEPVLLEVGAVSPVSWGARVGEGFISVLPPRGLHAVSVSSLPRPAPCTRPAWSSLALASSLLFPLPLLLLPSPSSFSPPPSSPSRPFPLIPFLSENSQRSVVSSLCVTCSVPPCRRTSPSLLDLSVSEAKPMKAPWSFMGNLFLVKVTLQ